MQKLCSHLPTSHLLSPSHHHQTSEPTSRHLKDLETELVNDFAASQVEIWDQVLLLWAWRRDEGTVEGAMAALACERSRSSDGQCCCNGLVPAVATPGSQDDLPGLLHRKVRPWPLLSICCPPFPCSLGNTLQLPKLKASPCRLLPQQRTSGIFIWQRDLVYRGRWLENWATSVCYILAFGLWVLINAFKKIPGLLVISESKLKIITDPFTGW